MIGIWDGQIADNNGNYEVKFKDGSTIAVTRLTGDITPQLRMDIAAFSRGIFRGFPYGEAVTYDGVEVIDRAAVNDGILDQIFYRKKNFLMEYF